ncbi:MAG TPA: hypothetical protein VK974_00690 [Methylophilaceae bacterium]|nr:hypothetical protein [Methylophilaceae bacterium]
MKSFLVKTTIKQLDKDGNAFFLKDGETIELNEKDALELKALSAVEDFNGKPAEPETPETPAAETPAAPVTPAAETPAVEVPVAPEGPAKLEAIKAAIATLDPKDLTLWTKAGQPTTAAIVAITKWEVSADERNTAFPLPEKAAS